LIKGAIKRRMKALYRHKRSGDIFAIETDKAGKICGIISVILQIIGLIVWLMMMALGVAGSFVSH